MTTNDADSHWGHTRGPVVAQIVITSRGTDQRAAEWKRIKMVKHQRDGRLFPVTLWVGIQLRVLVPHPHVVEVDFRVGVVVLTERTVHHSATLVAGYHDQWSIRRTVGGAKSHERSKRGDTYRPGPVLARGNDRAHR